MKVLIIEDEKIARKSLAKMLEKLGFYDVLETEGGLEALTIIQKKRPQIILSDIEMPNLDGIALLERIRHLNINCRVILISGHDLFQYAKKAIQYGVVDYILKPVDLDELHSALLKALSGLQDCGEIDEALYDKVSNTKRIIDIARSHIIENLSSPDLDLHSVAEIVHLSPNYLSRLFKNTTGELFSDFVTRQRIEIAMGALQKTNRKISQISMESGFSDTKYFFKVFKKYTGLTPNEYRCGPDLLK
jgi:YesN/AraC family two-component response regulator